MSFRDPKNPPLAFWPAFVALGFVTSFGSSTKPSGKGVPIANGDTASQD
jgi:hypothetical protein